MSAAESPSLLLQRAAERLEALESRAIIGPWDTCGPNVTGGGDEQWDVATASTSTTALWIATMSPAVSASLAYRNPSSTLVSNHRLGRAVMTHAATCDVEDRDGVCGAPTQAFLCSKHADEMLFWLYDIGGLSLDERGDYLPSLLDELDTTICRDDKMGSAPIGIVTRTGATGLAFNVKASQAKDALRKCVRQWTLMFADENQHLILDVATIEDAARWLSGFPNLLASHPSAVFMYQELEACVSAARRCIDRPAPRLYAGLCDGWNETKAALCGRRLFVPRKASTYECPECSTLHDVEKRQADLFAKLRNKVAPASQVVEALAFLGEKAHVKTLRTWISRGRLRNYTKGEGEPTVLVAEVLYLINGGDLGGVSTCAEAA